MLLLWKFNNGNPRRNIHSDTFYALLSCQRVLANKTARVFGKKRTSTSSLQRSGHQNKKKATRINLADNLYIELFELFIISATDESKSWSFTTNTDFDRFVLIFLSVSLS